jgi:hypothetical protein
MRISLILSCLLFFVGIGLVAQTELGKVYAIGDNIYHNSAGDAYMTDSGDKLIFLPSDSASMLVSLDQNNFPNWSTYISTSTQISGRILLLSDGNFLAMSRQDVPGASGKGHLVKFSSSGQVIWDRSFGTGNVVYNDILETSNGNIVVAARLNMVANLFCVDTLGNLLWTKAFSTNDGSLTSCGSLIKTNDDHILFVTDFNIFDPERFALTKLDFNGNVIWDKHFTTPGGYENLSNSHLMQSSTNDFYLLFKAYDTSSISYDSTFIIVRKFDVNGNWINGRRYRGTFDSRHKQIIERSDGDILFTGVDNPLQNCGGNLVIAKLDTSLNMLWYKHYGSSGGEGAFNAILQRDNDTLYGMMYGSFWSSMSQYTGSFFMCNEDFDLNCGTHIQPFYEYPAVSAQTVSSNFSFATNSFPQTDYPILSDPYIYVKNRCSGEFNGNSITTISEQVNCETYTSPSGNAVWNSTGFYVDTLTSVMGYDSIVQVNLTVTNNLTATIGNVSGVLVAGPNSVTYQWIDCEGYSIIPGATNQFYIPTSSNANYAVIVTDGTCVDTSDCFEFVHIQESGNDVMKFLPNPSNGEFFVQSSESIIDIRLYEFSGKLIRSISCPPNTNLAKIDQLPAGTFVVEVGFIDGTIERNKVVVQH